MIKRVVATTSEPDPAEDRPSASELQRLVVQDGHEFVCSDDDFANEMEYLQAKVNAGADFIVTQMFFDPECFLAFVRAARTQGIQCPIIPGIMCIQNYDGFQRIIKFCKSRVPVSVQQKLETLRDSPERVKAYGIQMGIELCTRVLNAKDAGILGLHFYTLNQDYVVTEIVKALLEGHVVRTACESIMS